MLHGTGLVRHPKLHDVGQFSCALCATEDTILRCSRSEDWCRRCSKPATTNHLIWLCFYRLVRSIPTNLPTIRRLLFNFCRRLGALRCGSLIAKTGARLKHSGERAGWTKDRQSASVSSKVYGSPQQGTKFDTLQHVILFLF